MFSIKKKLNHWKTYKRTRNELQSLSDRDLADIGIKRWDIERIASQHAVTC